MQRQMARGDEDYAKALEAQQEEANGKSLQDKKQEDAAAAELLALETKVKDISAASEAAEARMKKQSEAFLARERAVAEIEAQV